MITSFLHAAFAVFLFMTLGFSISVLRRRNDIADTLWGLGFVLVAYVSLIGNGTYAPTQLLITALVTIWGLRLALHIYLRNRKKQEDHRYEAMQKEWKGNFYLNSYLRVFLTQGLLLFLISIPVVFINSNLQSSINWIVILGLVIWLKGFFFESVGDYQLSQFLKNPKNHGHVMQSGLWKYTRHPNYYGEVMQWWGIFVIALSLPYGIITITGPLIITLLITKVSGIPLLEKKYAGRSEWETYKKRTSSFIPWFPKK